jgi:hypothetical protein
MNYLIWNIRGILGSWKHLKSLILMHGLCFVAMIEPLVSFDHLASFAFRLGIQNFVPMIPAKFGCFEKNFCLSKLL